MSIDTLEVDLAGEGASRRQLERALDQAEIHHLHLPIGPLLKRCARRRGAPLLRATLEWHLAGSTITESEAEGVFSTFSSTEIRLSAPL